MSAPLFNTHIIVDWSARSAPSPARPAADAIWWGVVRDSTAEPPVYARTRADALGRLTAILVEERRAGRRVLIGFDFPFGYPAGVAERLTGTPHAYALWDWIAARVGDAPDNSNRRFAVAEEINAAYDGTGPMWGRPAAWDHPGVPVTMKERHGTDHPPERRRAERLSKTAKTVWQLAYSGSVGSQVLLGLPALKALREATPLRDHLAVWPFDTGLSTPEAQIVVAEIYPSILQPQVHARKTADEILDAAQVRTLAEAFAALDAAGGLPELFAGHPDLTDADRHAICQEEAWILGLGHEDRLRAALDAPTEYERDPKAIYAKSFATVRAEANLDRLPEDLAEVAIRLIHSCGMTDLADTLAYDARVTGAARGALRAGAPILCDCQMVASGIIARGLPAENDILTTLNEPSVPDRAARLATTRSAAAVDLWDDHLEDAIVAIGNAPTALFRLLEKLDEGAARPAAILAFPVGFVGAAESKAALAANPRGVPFLTLPGRRGGSAMASAAVNAMTLGLKGDGT